MQKDLFFQLLNSHSNFHEKAITNRRFKYEQIVPFIKTLHSDKRFEVKIVGSSFEERDIYLVKWGSGATKILMWSQMHGNEPTATKAILDIWNFLKGQDHEFSELRSKLSENLSLYFIPVLNPDGTNMYQRNTVQGIDMNRDALSLQTPEARILKEMCDSIKPEYGFNLHDQSIYYSAGTSSLPATISFLSPAYNEEKKINEGRADAMKLIGLLNHLLQKVIPGQIGKYDDTYNSRAFGDNIQKWGISTMLIESGGYANDPDKEYVRKLNFAILIRAFNAIYLKEINNQTLEGYHSIPFNVKENFFDLLIRNAVIEKNGKEFKVDLGINREEVSYNDHKEHYLVGSIIEIGDLSNFNGYRELDVNGRKVMPGKVYPLQLKTHAGLNFNTYEKSLKDGYTYVVVEDFEDFGQFYNGPVNLISNSGDPSKLKILPDSPANLIVTDKNKVIQTIVNGFLVNFDEPGFGVENGLVF